MLDITKIFLSDVQKNSTCCACHYKMSMVLYHISRFLIFSRHLERQSPDFFCIRLGTNWSRFEPWPGSWCVVFLGKTFFPSHYRNQPYKPSCMKNILLLYFFSVYKNCNTIHYIIQYYTTLHYVVKKNDEQITKFRKVAVLLVKEGVSIY